MRRKGLVPVQRLAMEPESSQRHLVRRRAPTIRAVSAVPSLATTTRTATLGTTLWTKEQQHTFSSDSKRPDPLARRPNRVCDPYGLGGKPLALADATLHYKTLDPGWRLEGRETDSTTNATSSDPPLALVREFRHADYLTAARFLHVVSAVAQQNNHYPTIRIERRLAQAAWQVVTTVTCQTLTLQGLSHSDFFIAMLIDVETARPEVNQLLLSTEESSRRHT